MDELINLLESGKYLPEKLRGFDNQQNFFKSMHFLTQNNEGAERNPSWVQGHIYVIDYFLWFMAARGYTLQKTRRKNVEFKEWPNFRELVKSENIQKQE